MLLRDKEFFDECDWDFVLLEWEFDFFLVWCRKCDCFLLLFMLLIFFDEDESCLDEYDDELELCDFK